MLPIDKFGLVLKEWRGKRRLSQMELGLVANVSARHIAFLETGRARPSRSMVMQLGEALEVPRTERNRLLDAAGFRPAWTTRTLNDTDMEPVLRAITRIIERHDPYPALVINRHWKIVMTNQAGAMILVVFNMNIGDSLLNLMSERGRAAAMIENWPEVAAHTLARLRTESAHLGGDAVLDAAASQLAADLVLKKAMNQSDMPAVIPARYKMGDQTLSVFSTILQFGSAEDIALADLRIELLFPADEETRKVFEG